MQTVFDNKHLLWRGLELTLELSAVIIVCGTLLGILIGIGLLYGNRVVRTLLRLYVDLIRGLPLLVLIFLLFYGLPALKIEILGVTIPTNFSRFAVAAIAFSMFAGAHVGEIVRGGLHSLPKGQTDAGKAIGLTFWARLRYILFPQALPQMIPPWVNTAVELVKGTSLVTLVSLNDFLFASRKIGERTGDVVPVYIAAAIVYFIVNFTISRAGARVARRLRVGVA
jgi:polar amino acid transport system permease protein